MNAAILDAKTIIPGSKLTLEGDYIIEGDVPQCALTVKGNLEVRGNLMGSFRHGSIQVSGTFKARDIVTGTWEITADAITARDIKDSQADCYALNGDIVLGNVENTSRRLTLNSAGKITLKHGCCIDADAQGSVTFDSLERSDVTAASIQGGLCKNSTTLTSTIGDVALDTVDGKGVSIRSMYDVRLANASLEEIAVKCQGKYLIAGEAQPKELAIEESCGFGGGNCGGYLPLPQHKGCGILYSDRIGVECPERYSIPKAPNQNSDMENMLSRLQKKGISVREDTLLRNGQPVDVWQFSELGASHALEQTSRKELTRYVATHREKGL